MKITTLEVESMHGSAEGQRMIFFRATDDTGIVHSIGPVFTTDPDFDPEALRDIIIAKIEESMSVEGGNDG